MTAAALLTRIRLAATRRRRARAEHRPCLCAQLTAAAAAHAAELAHDPRRAGWRPWPPPDGVTPERVEAMVTDDGTVERIWWHPGGEPLRGGRL